MKVRILTILLLVSLTLFVFWDVGSHEFINYDDDIYVTGNEWVKAGLSAPGTVWALTSTTAGIWHPLTWISHMMDGELFGSTSKGHHLMSLFFHVVNGLLLFLLLERLTGCRARSGLVAALFLIHPLHVESVAWIAERKDVLSGLFWMLTLHAYAAYAARPHPRNYFLVLLAYTLGLLAKPMLVTLPFVMLLLDFWPLRRATGSQPDRPGIRRLLLEKVPLFVLSAAACIIAVIAQMSVDAVAEALPLATRLENSAVSYIRYIIKMVWPIDLAVLYPHPETMPVGQWAGAVLLLLAITYTAILTRHRNPHVLVGWLWFLGTLVPVIGVVQVGQQAMADRYTYLPLIGLFLAVCWSVPESPPASRWSRAALPIVATGLLTTLAVVSRGEVSYWHDSFSLYRHALEVTESNFAVRTNLGAAHAARGAFLDAIAEYREAIRINPNVAQIHYNLGVAQFRSGYPAAAASCYTDALRIDPRHAPSHNNLGYVLNLLGKHEEAAAHFKEALRIDPGNPSAYRNLLEYEAAKQGKEVRIK